MRVAVINLVRSTDRREWIESNLARIGLTFEIFAGVDAFRGEHVGISRYNEAAARRDLHRPMAAGEIGCFASHYLLWQRCLSAREPLVIMEDDVDVDYAFLLALDNASKLISRFPLIRLGLTREGDGTAPMLCLPDDFQLVLLGSWTFGTQCYVLSPIGAKALLEHAAVWSLPLDIYVDRAEIHGIGNYGLRPYFVTHADQSAGLPSVIGDERYGEWPAETSTAPA
ncbi:MAG TPA: glycosyltransferase family 25 protein [Bryobacteraceae bacterium]|nr:glycosyltransferase family 25 protein [Bryobacteraceae bacterium]